MDLKARLCLEFDRPVDKSGLQHLRLSEKVDTLYQPVDFKVNEDERKVRTVYVDAPWKAGGE